MCPVGRGDNFSYIPETACAKGVNDKPVLPMNKRSLCFHKFQSELSLSSLVHQLSSSTLTKLFEKKTPKILILFTHLRPKGVSPLVRHLPSHISSDLEVFNLAPEPNPNLWMTSSREERDLSDLRMQVASSVYCEILYWRPPVPGSGKPSIYLHLRIWVDRIRILKHRVAVTVGISD